MHLHFRYHNFFPAAEMEEEDFGLITPSLIKQLKSILYQYPDSGQILKVTQGSTVIMFHTMSIAVFSHHLLLLNHSITVKSLI